MFVYTKINNGNNQITKRNLFEKMIFTKNVHGFEICPHTLRGTILLRLDKKKKNVHAKRGSFWRVPCIRNALYRIVRTQGLQESQPCKPLAVLCRLWCLAKCMQWSAPCSFYREFTRLAETRLAQNNLNYLEFQVMLRYVSLF